jgi:hypothetical protein
VGEGEGERERSMADCCKVYYGNMGPGTDLTLTYGLASRDPQAYIMTTRVDKDYINV